MTKRLLNEVELEDTEERSNKRKLDDNTSTSLPIELDSDPFFPTDLDLTPALSTAQVFSTLEKWIDLLQSRITSSEDFTSTTTSIDKGKGKEVINTDNEMNSNTSVASSNKSGSITLTNSEAGELLLNLKSTYNAFDSTPATKGDLMQLLLQRVEYGRRSYVENYWDTVAPVAERDPASKSPFERLPEDIILMVVAAVRNLFIEADKDKEPNPHASTPQETSLLEVKELASLNKSWGSALSPLIIAERHINDSRDLPSLAKNMRNHPSFAKRLTSLHIRVSDYEICSTRVIGDAGFSLPDCIRLAPNLLHFSLQTDSNTVNCPSTRSSREPNDATSFTGGVSIPATLITHCKKLRTLIFAIPCSVDDVSNLTSQLPDLVQLTVIGEIDSTNFSKPFRTCGPKLKKLWLPTTPLGPISLANLTLKSSIDSLAILLDIDDYFNPVPPSQESIESTKTKFIKLFNHIGPQLLELSIATPFSDLHDSTRLRLPLAGRVNGGRGANGGGANAGAVNGLAGLGNNIAMQIIQTVGGVLNGPGGMGGIGQLGQVQVQVNGGPIQNGNLPPPGPVPAGPVPAVNPGNGGGGRARAAAGPGAGVPGAGLNLGAGAFQIPGIHLFGFNQMNALAPPTQFFKELIVSCPKLIHLELSGRRYGINLLSTLSDLDSLEYLCLTIPVEVNRSLLFNTELERIFKVGLKGLRRFELSSRGGDWLPTERRSMKEICEGRGIKYSSR